MAVCAEDAARSVSGAGGVNWDSSHGWSSKESRGLSAEEMKLKGSLSDCLFTASFASSLLLALLAAAEEMKLKGSLSDCLFKSTCLMGP